MRKSFVCYLCDTHVHLNDGESSESTWPLSNSSSHQMPLKEEFVERHESSFGYKDENLTKILIMDPESVDDMIPEFCVSCMMVLSQKFNELSRELSQNALDSDELTAEVDIENLHQRCEQTLSELSSTMPKKNPNEFDKDAALHTLKHENFHPFWTEVNECKDLLEAKTNLASLAESPEEMPTPTNIQLTSLCNESKLEHVSIFRKQLQAQQCRMDTYNFFNRDLYHRLRQTAQYLSPGNCLSLLLDDLSSTQSNVEELYHANRLLNDEVEYLTECYNCLKRKNSKTSEFMNYLRSSSLLNMAFHIWKADSSYTINGCRLGRHSNSSDLSRVSYDETNAAWGYVTLLLQIIKDRLGIEFSDFDLIPLGNYSKIIVRSSQQVLSIQKEETDINRFHSMRLLDFAMTCLLRCVEETVRHLERVAVNLSKCPFKIQHDRVGEYSIKSQFNSNEKWDKSLRYLLLIIKWIIVELDKQDNSNQELIT